MCIVRVSKGVRLFGANGVISILSVRKDDRLLRGNRDMYRVSVGKIIKLTRVKGTWPY
jgi:hypothetical protein